MVTSLLCAHMLSVNVPLVTRQPMNFNGMGYAFEQHGQIYIKKKTIAFSSSFLLLYSAFTVQWSLYSEGNFHFPLHKRVRII